VTFSNPVNDNPVAEVQTVTVLGSSGTFTLTFNGQTTSALPFNASAQAVEDALNLLSSIAHNRSVKVTRGTTNASNGYTVTFGAPLVGVNLLAMTAQASPGLTVNVATRNNGASGSDLTVLGGGQIDLQGSNTYKGSTFIKQGVLVIEDNQALGAAGTAE